MPSGHAHIEYLPSVSVPMAMHTLPVGMGNMKLAVDMQSPLDVLASSESAVDTDIGALAATNTAGTTTTTRASFLPRLT
jgi:hypothetical protein